MVVRYFSLLWCIHLHLRDMPLYLESNFKPSLICCIVKWFAIVYSSLQNTTNFRSLVMVFLGMFVALPLGLLRNVESLSNISALSLAFYTVFITEVFLISFCLSSKLEILERMIYILQLWFNYLFSWIFIIFCAFIYIFKLFFRCLLQLYQISGQEYG